MAQPYPAHWEADVVLRDGGTAHIRPMSPDDRDRLVRMHARLSDQTIYFRFFAFHRLLSDKEVERFTRVDHVDRIALIAVVGEEMIGVVRCERVSPGEAEVAFVIEDAHQARGLGSVFLEHLAAAARERGIGRFVADVLPNNRKMINVFQEAGYVVKRDYDDGVTRLEFSLAPTETSTAVTQTREHRAEARSVERLLRPRSVAVVGASRTTRSVGNTVLRHVVAGGFTGAIHPVNPHATEVNGMACFPSVGEIPGDVDLAVIAVPAEQVDAVVVSCAAKNVRGLVVMSAGFAETGPAGRDRQLRLVRAARANGMRVVGPSSFGLINTEPDVSLNASLSPTMPDTGRVGFFSQSGGLGIALLERVVRRGLGLSTFVSAGNRVDLSGNDLMQFWEDDAGTDAVMLYLESVGNARKFSRIARRLARAKPVIVVKSGRFHGAPPQGHVVRETRAPAAAIDALFTQAGVIRVDTIHDMFDVGQLVAHQPLPAGPRVAILGNSDSLGLLAAEACEQAGLDLVGNVVDLGVAALPADFDAALTRALADDRVDSVLVQIIPSLVAEDEDVARVLATAARLGTKTVVATFLGMGGVPAVLRATEGFLAVPSYSTPEDAVRALARVTDYAKWRATPPGALVEPAGVDPVAARAVVTEALAAMPEGAPGVELDHATTAAILVAYGIELWESEPAQQVELAVSAAARLGYPVALKTLAPHLRHRRDLGGVRLDITDEGEMRNAHAVMTERLGPEAAAHLIVQRMAPTGVACVVGSVEDLLFGPVVSFGLGGVATELMGDRAYLIPPLTDADVSALVRSVATAPLLFGHRGAEPVDVAALEDLLARMTRLADDLPEVAELELNPVVVGVSGVAVLSASGRLAHPRVRADRGPRALSG